MSGGVDSSVSAYLLKEMGFEVIGLSFELWDQRDIKNPNICCSIETINIAKQVAESLGIEHYTVDVRDAFFKYVIEDFCSSYISGLTPNPCILCNKFIKFDFLLKKAQELGAEMIATGHYARIKKTEDKKIGSSEDKKGQKTLSDLTSQLLNFSSSQIQYSSLVTRHSLLKGVDPKKDQSYVLYIMTQEELSRTIFPLGELRKDETRNIASRLGLVNALRAESQEICFVGNGEYIDFIKEFAPYALRPGFIVSMEGKVLGEHKGLAYYTIGQRKRLGIASSKPLYVVNIKRDDNTIVVGRREDSVKETLKAKELNWVSIEALSEPIKAMVKVRSTMKEEPATIIPVDGERVLVEFDKPQWALTPGQSAVFYNGDVVIGGGIIE
ncbi:MAG: tRNA-specific 2-thiouridylase [Nitrospirae bacterium]|nr:tRNA-specific 2-thiouridylase [Nitrospirota bacterium]